MEEKKKINDVKSPKKIRVKSFNCHVAVPVGTLAAGGYSNGLGNKPEHKFSMELHPSGVVLQYDSDPSQGKLIPFTNIQYIDVEIE